MLEMMTKDYFSSSSSLTAAYSFLQLNIIILHDLQENWYCLKHLIFELHLKVDGTSWFPDQTYTISFTLQIFIT